VKEGAEVVIIAGDLFDASRRSYAELEGLCHDQRFAGLRILVIPSNHDADLS
jgi:DNA repair exonuclease SbcCD nuclease subunit